MSDRLSDQDQLEIEAAVYRTLIDHLRKKTNVQNIDLMNLADFCRNCLSKWYVAAAKDKGIAIEYEQAREIVYGMPYSEWKEKYQKEATAEQKQAFKEREMRHSNV